MRTISMLNTKGGVGKTTTSVNVATGLAMQGKRVLLVDLDPQSNTTSNYVFDTPEANTSTLLKGETTPDETIVAADENLWLIPSYLELAQTEVDMRMQSNMPQHNRLLKALEQVKNRFDYCIVDCSPTINLLTINAIIASDLIIVPIKPDKYALQGFGVTTQNIKQIKENWELNLDMKILFTIVNRNNEEKAIIEQLSALLPGNVFNTIVRSQPKPIAAASAANKAVIRDTRKDVGVAEDYRKLVEELMGVI